MAIHIAHLEIRYSYIDNNQILFPQHYNHILIITRSYFLNITTVTELNDTIDLPHNSKEITQQ